MPKTCKQFCQAYQKKTLKLMDALDTHLMKSLTPADQKKYKAFRAKSRKSVLKKIPLECKIAYFNKLTSNQKTLLNK